MEDMTPKNLEEFGGGMSNLDFSIDDGVEDALRSGRFFARYAGWNFNGIVWFDGDRFVCQPWTYHYPNELHKEPTLKELMYSVSSEYGYE